MERNPQPGDLYVTSSFEHHTTDTQPATTTQHVATDILAVQGFVTVRKFAAFDETRVEARTAFMEELGLPSRRPLWALGNRLSSTLGTPRTRRLSARRCSRPIHAYQWIASSAWRGVVRLRLDGRSSATMGPRVPRSACHAARRDLLRGRRRLRLTYGRRHHRAVKVRVAQPAGPEDYRRLMRTSPTSGS